MTLPARYLLAFALTQLLEMPIYLRALRVRPLAAFGASALTHPIVVFAMPHLWRSLYLVLHHSFAWFTLSDRGYGWGYGVLAESFAVGAEALYFWVLGIPPKKAFLWSLLANALSALTGLLLQATLGIP